MTHPQQQSTDGRARKNKPAILLIGPTGSGKTPLGEYIATHGIFQNRFAHFDFGEMLRQTAAGTWDSNLAATDVARLQSILDSGALLEKDNFYLAERIISHFNTTTIADAVVLNGLPRHRQQAKDISPWFDIRLVIHLVCSAETVVTRIQSNSGKDRAQRDDDQIELVKRKLSIFSTRTAPLCQWFSNQGIEVVDIPVEMETQPAHIVAALNKKMPCFSI